MRAFVRIDNADLRRRIVMLVQEIAGDDDLGCLARSTRARFGELTRLGTPLGGNRWLSQTTAARGSYERLPASHRV